MKKTLLLWLFALPLLLWGQQVVENSYLKMKVPDGWQVENRELPDLKIELLSFSIEGAGIFNMGMVIGQEQMQDPTYMLQQQIELKANNALFQYATFGDIVPSTFMGKPASMVNFTTTVAGVPANGAAYAFNEGGCSLLAVGVYKVGTVSRLPQIWRSITWKRHKRTETHYASMREEVEAYCEGLNRMLAAHPQVVEGVQFMSINCGGQDEVRLEYHYQVLGMNRDDLTEEQIRKFREQMKPLLIANLRQDSQGVELVRRCMDASYTFVFVYDDKNGKPVATVSLYPEDYSMR